MKNPYISLHNLKQKTQSSLATTSGLETQHYIPGADPASKVRERDFSNIW